MRSRGQRTKSSSYQMFSRFNRLHRFYRLDNKSSRILLQLVLSRCFPRRRLRQLRVYVIRMSRNIRMKVPLTRGDVRRRCRSSQFHRQRRSFRRCLRFVNTISGHDFFRLNERLFRMHSHRSSIPSISQTKGSSNPSHVRRTGIFRR